MTRNDEAGIKKNPYRAAVAPTLNGPADYIRAVTCGDAEIINYSLWEARQRPEIYVQLFRALGSVPRPSLAQREAFQSAWITQGLYVREHFAVDPYLPSALANLMPGYSGPPVQLFRGERASNHHARCYGPSWTSKRRQAEDFASGLNRCRDTGGVLLTTLAPASAILAAPSEKMHMQHEAEYVVDRRLLGAVEILETYLPES